MTEQDSITPEDRLLEILENPEQRILPLFLKSTDPAHQNVREETRTELVGIAQHLFRSIEETAKRYHQISIKTTENESEEDKEDEETPALSGLSEMYVPEDTEAPLDFETLWGQVELQNTALNKLVKKSTKKLAKSPSDVVVLDLDRVYSDDDDDDGKEDDDSNEEAMDENDNSDEEEEEDEEARRIRERMERAMDDAESDEEEEDSSEKEEPTKLDKLEKKKEPFDPVAEEMKDGFFDLNDMEGFADEEEDYLPQEAYGETEVEKKRKKQEKQKKSFHQMQRDGDLVNRSDDEDDEDGLDDLYEENEEPVKRNKYREEEDIEALYSMYQGGSQEDKAGEDAVNMTAAEFFGQPSKEHMQRYNAKKAREEIKDDDDSWGEYDFEQDEEDDEDHNHGRSKTDSDAEENNDEEDDDTGRGGTEDHSEKEADKITDNSWYAKQEDKLRKQTEELENELLSEKPWQMKGETKSTARPVNSLLEGTPEFEMASKQAPAITVEHTASLEDVIKKRILAEDWDDVVPRELPDVGWHKKRGELPEVSQEKSKLGLGELYEREYLKKAVGYDKDAEERKTEEDKAKDEMKGLFANLCSKLDGLSNYHFAPRPVADEAEVRTSNTPAIAMEEVLPLHVNDARGVAPEEVYATKRGREGVLRGESEMDQQERKRLRQSKKAARRKARKEKLADEKLISRLQPGLGLNNPYEKRKMQEELSMARSRGRVATGEQDMDVKYGSSGTFFKRLQAEAQQTIRGDDGVVEEKQKKTKPKSSALKL